MNKIQPIFYCITHCFCDCEWKKINFIRVRVNPSIQMHFAPFCSMLIVCEVRESFAIVHVSDERWLRVCAIFLAAKITTKRKEWNFVPQKRDSVSFALMAVFFSFLVLITHTHRNESIQRYLISWLDKIYKMRLDFRSTRAPRHDGTESTPNTIGGKNQALNSFCP